MIGYVVLWILFDSLQGSDTIWLWHCLVRIQSIMHSYMKLFYFSISFDGCKCNAICYGKLNHCPGQSFMWLEYWITRSLCSSDDSIAFGIVYLEWFKKHIFFAQIFVLFDICVYKLINPLVTGECNDSVQTFISLWPKIFSKFRSIWYTSKL